MGRFGKLAAVLGATLAMAVAGSARAATWMVTYNAQAGFPTMANLTLDVADTLNAVGGYDVLAVSGDVDGDAVTGLIANPIQPFPSYSADGMFIFDNVVWNSAPNLSGPGLFFAGASGDEYNLFSDNASTYELYRARSGVGYLANSVGSVVAYALPPQHSPLGGGGLDVGAVGGAVPEPATWAVMILGFGLAGSALRRRREA